MRSNRILWGLLLLVQSLFFISCSEDETPETTPTPSVLSIQCNGQEVTEGQTIEYKAEVDELFGDIVAGHGSDLSFVSTQPCRLDVSVTIPPCDIQYIQWCGITHQCTNYEPGQTYTRTVPSLTAKEMMDMHAYFKTGVYADCKVKVAVQVDSKPERTFYIRYTYSNSKP